MRVSSWSAPASSTRSTKTTMPNLARMYSFWYSRFDRNPEQLRQAIEWYRQGHEIAPQDVVILNE